MEQKNISNIFDYLKWRADVPFEADPFNEVDQLVLCELAYTDFAGLIPDAGGVTISDLHRRFFETNDREDFLRGNSYIDKAPLLMDDMITGSRFGDMTVSGYLSEIDGGRESQIGALTFMPADGTCFVAFRGTDSSLVGWKEDFNLSYLCETEGQRKAVSYLEAAAKKTDRPIRVGGHSKGGNFAVYAAAFCGPDVRERISCVYTNDGPGFRQEVTETEGYLRILPKVRSFVPDTSVIGQLLTHRYVDTVVSSSGIGIMQHDGFSWRVERNRFERSGLSDFGEFVRRTQTDWLAKMDDDVRESFVNTLFSALETTGAETFHEISAMKIKAAERLLDHMKNLPKEKQLEFVHVIGELLKSSGDTAKAFIPEIIERERHHHNGQ